MSTPLLLRLVLWLWLLAALMAGGGDRARLSPAALPALLLGLTGLLLLAYRRSAALRTWIEGLDLRSFALLHLTRFFGVYLLLLGRDGLLPPALGLRAGWAEILVATLVIPACFLPLSPSQRLRALTIWNFIGSFDLLLLLATTGRLALAGDPRLSALGVLPLSLLPTFLVPLLLSTHLVLFLRLRAATAPAA